MPDESNHNAFVQIARIEERCNTLFRILEEREKQSSAILSASQRATDKAEESQTRVNVASNEWRAAMSDARATFAQRVELDAHGERIKFLEQTVSRLTGQSGGQSAARAITTQNIALLIMGIGVLVSLVVAILG